MLRPSVTLQLTASMLIARDRHRVVLLPVDQPLDLLIEYHRTPGVYALVAVHGQEFRQVLATLPSERAARRALRRLGGAAWRPWHWLAASAGATLLLFTLWFLFLLPDTPPLAGAGFPDAGVAPDDPDANAAWSTFSPTRRANYPLPAVDTDPAAGPLTTLQTGSAGEGAAPASADPHRAREATTAPLPTSEAR